MNEQASGWLTAVEGLPAVHARLKRVVIVQDDALAVIRREDTSNTFFYCDPPYLHATRVTTREYGSHEMSEDDHRQLLELLASIKGKFMLSGYRSELYDRYALVKDWRREDFPIANHASSAKAKRTMTECVWMNY
jgi:DNA adenine methylase